jgi:hypothetical protein
MTTPTIPITLADQFAAALSAPIPFLLAVLAVAFAIWGVVRWAYQWRYDGTIERLEAMLRLVAEERRIAKESESGLRVEIEGLNEEVEKLRVQKSEDKALQPIIKEVLRRTLSVDSELARVNEANTAVDNALRRAATGTAAGHASVRGVSATSRSE